MIRGTTPTHIFKLPFQSNRISKIRIVYAQSKKIVLEKNENDCVLSDDTVSVTLSEEDTMLFRDWLDVQIQIRLVLSGGEVLSSNIFETDIGPLLKDEVLSDVNTD